MGGIGTTVLIILATLIVAIIIAIITPAVMTKARAILLWPWLRKKNSTDHIPKRRLRPTVMMIIIHCLMVVGRRRSSGVDVILR